MFPRLLWTLTDVSWPRRMLQANSQQPTTHSSGLLTGVRTPLQPACWPVPASSSTLLTLWHLILHQPVASTFTQDAAHNVFAKLTVATMHILRFSSQAARNRRTAGKPGMFAGVMAESGRGREPPGGRTWGRSAALPSAPGRCASLRRRRAGWPHIWLPGDSSSRVLRFLSL